MNLRCFRGVRQTFAGCWPTLNGSSDWRSTDTDPTKKATLQRSACTSELQGYQRTTAVTVDGNRLSRFPSVHACSFSFLPFWLRSLRTTFSRKVSTLSCMLPLATPSSTSFFKLPRPSITASWRRHQPWPPSCRNAAASPRCRSTTPLNAALTSRGNSVPSDCKQQDQTQSLVVKSRKLFDSSKAIVVKHWRAVDLVRRFWRCMKTSPRLRLPRIDPDYLSKYVPTSSTNEQLILL